MIRSCSTVHRSKISYFTSNRQQRTKPHPDDYIADFREHQLRLYPRYLAGRRAQREANHGIDHRWDGFPYRVVGKWNGGYEHSCRQARARRLTYSSVSHRMGTERQCRGHEWTRQHRRWRTGRGLRRRVASTGSRSLRCQDMRA